MTLRADKITVINGIALLSETGTVKIRVILPPGRRLAVSRKELDHAGVDKE